MAQGSSPREPQSVAGAVGAGLGSAVRVLSGDGNKRVARGLMSGTGAFLQAVGKVLHLLWLEVTGFIFLCFAIIGSFALVREYPSLKAGNISNGRFAATLVFTVMFAWFGLSSFWRARRKQ